MAGGVFVVRGTSGRGANKYWAIGQMAIVSFSAGLLFESDNAAHAAQTRWAGLVTMGWQIVYLIIYFTKKPKSPEKRASA